jgi:hypothetical protein
MHPITLLRNCLENWLMPIRLFLHCDKRSRDQGNQPISTNQDSVNRRSLVAILIPHCPPSSVTPGIDPGRFHIVKSLGILLLGMLSLCSTLRAQLGATITGTTAACQNGSWPPVVFTGKANRLQWKNNYVG